MGNLCLGPSDNSRPTPHARPASRIDLNEAVDKLQLSDLKTIQSRFALIAAQQTPVGRRGGEGHRSSHGPGLSYVAFQQALPSLQELGVGLQKAVFKAFNMSYHEDLVDLRDFSGALAICRHGSRRQKLEFVLRIFSFLRDAGGVSSLAESSAGVALSREQFEKLREHFHVSDAIVRDQPRSSSSTTTPSHHQNGGHHHRPPPRPPSTTPRGGGSGFIPSETVPLDAFLHWADGGQLSDDRINAFLSLLIRGAVDTPERELARITSSMKEAARAYHAKVVLMSSSSSSGGGVAPPPPPPPPVVDPVYLLSAAWWHSWCDYVGAGPEVRGAPPPSPSIAARGGSGGGAAPKGVVPRPNEIDNGDIGGRLGYVVKPGIQEGVHFVVLPSRTWEELWDLYGGGPAFPRHCGLHPSSSSPPAPRRPPPPSSSSSNEAETARLAAGESPSPPPLPAAVPQTSQQPVGGIGSSSSGDKQAPPSSSSSSLPTLSSSSSPTASPTSSSSSLTLSWHDVRRRFTVDLYPLLLQVSLCYRSTLISPENKDLPFLISCKMTPYVELCHILSDFFLLDYDRNKTKTQARFWVMRTSRRLEKRGSGNEWMPVVDTLHDDEEEEEEEGEGGNQSGGGSGEQQQQAAESTEQQQPPPRRTPSSSSTTTTTPPAAQVARPKGSTNHHHSSQPQPSSSSTNAALRWELVDREAHAQGLEGVGLQHTDRLLIEIKEGDEPWPRDALIEKPDFRDFKIGQRLDAIDYQGKCFSATVVAVEEVPSSATIARRSKGEEEDDDDEGEETATEDDDDDEEEEEDPARTERRPPPAPPSRQQTPLPQPRRVKVKVHFDNFASKWDEWYDSDSPKLCPEGSITGNKALPPPPPSSSSSTSATSNTGSGGGNNSNSANGGGAAAAGASSAISRLSPLKNRFSRPSPVRDRSKAVRGSASSGGVGNGGASGANKSLLEGGGGIITDAGKQLLSLPSSVPGVPFRPGGCGLANLGNTCFINAALQCLSHTPLLKSYFLSHQFERDINTKNVLGTQGRVAEEFTALLKALWGNEYVSISPSKFRRTLAKYKPQFAGNEQQDSQEFLTVMLDSLHEDVNRVIDKPYVQNPDDDDDSEESHKPLQQLSAEAWDRHLKRNQSVIVNLFQGQVKCQTQCVECSKKSITFDPLHFLSVPVPAQTERFIKVTILPRVKACHVSSSSSASSSPNVDPPQLRPVVYGMLLPRDSATVAQVLSFLSEKSGIPEDRLVLVELGRHRIQRTIDGKEPLSVLRDDDILVAYERAPITRWLVEAPVTAVTSSLGTTTTHPPSQPPPPPPPLPPSLSGGASSADGPSVASPPPPLPPAIGGGGSRTAETANLSSGGLGSSSSTTTPSLASQTMLVEEEANDSDLEEEEVERRLLGGSSSSGEGGGGVRRGLSSSSSSSEMEGGEEAWPPDVTGLSVGSRVDAVDYRGSWYVGSVIRIEKQPEFRVLVHFDRFSSKWDEWYNAESWREGKLLPPYTKTVRRRKVLEAQVVHRRPLSGTGGAVARYSTPTASGAEDHQRRRSSSGTGGSSVVGAGMKEVFGLPFFVQCNTNRGFRHLYWRVIKQALRFLSPDARQLALKSLRTHGTAAAQGGSTGTGTSDLPFVVRIVSHQQPSTTCGICKVAGCQGCLLPVSSRHLVCNAITSTISLSLDWTDPSAYYDALTRPVLDQSYCDIEARQAQRMGVTLADCLDEYTKEETLDEEACWRCSRCKAYRKGKRQDQLWKLPDVLVIHIKRFLVAGRWRDKIRTRVDYPLEGLDMSPWLYRGEGAASSGLDAKDCVYDLFGVINHLGGMTGGHYTAACRSHSLNQDGSTEGLESCATGVWKVSPTWLSFDDESVTALHADEIVTSSAYVLFYSRRRFRASNVLNTWSNHED